ncbi:MFS transporter [Limosilactobacillus difficilis]|uniref:MFS transporter n=1 Tax=Limosilactobacillus difficilis TaxID=2991838 RepID=UPI0024BA3801|nr:MFS transporter [Limosilactobacillus difficilis]
MDQQLSQHHFRILAILFMIISFMLGCNESMVIGNLTLIAHTYQESLSQISLLVSVFAWTYAIVTPFLTMATSSLNRYRLLMALLLVFLFGTVLSSFAPNLWCLYLSRIITASVAGSIESLLSVIIYSLSDDLKQRSIAVAYIYTGFSVASVIGIPLGTMIAHRWRWQDAFVMVAAITLFAILVTAHLLPHNLPGQRTKHKDQLVIFRDPQTWAGIFFIISAAASFFGYYTYIRPLIRQSLGFSAVQLSLILSLLGVIDIIANQTSGRIAAGPGFRAMKYIYLLNLVLFASFSTVMRTKWLGLAWLFILALTAAMSASPSQVFFMNLATRQYPDSLSLASTFSAIFYNVGIAVASMSGGQLLKYTSLPNLGWNSFAYCLLATGLVFWLAKRDQGAKDLNRD